MTMPAELSVRRYGRSHGSHSHPHQQILFGLAGQLEIEVEGRGHRVGRGHALLIEAGSRHDFEAHGQSTCLVIDTPLRPPCESNRRLVLDASQMRLLDYLGAAADRGVEQIAHHGAGLLLAEIGQVRAADAARGRHIDWAALETWLQRRLDQPLTVADLARQVFLSPSHFAERCRLETGRPPLSWVRAQRLEHARRLLDAGLPVGVAAARCGYRSPSALTAALRRR